MVFNTKIICLEAANQSYILKQQINRIPLRRFSFIFCYEINIINVFLSNSVKDLLRIFKIIS